ncbi:murein transglycosylase [Blastomyces dermatitidis ER-3]|uniref:Arabinan endo-1,5-alpha-L-arabinosidase n=3 Tax=Blastomyces TaxID=229219 RepID=A0A179UBV7_BLAGS|nr:murein transglycosylase [Blastomyces gilchristii SLH14081]XP_045280628.1 murein transglycosylase [Blastomyces dermatitidis ER-3]EGE77129.2 murein transglycosylase [Blastomyces dermatitidis ATCC 18188]OAT00901.1 murein transglycosylase [Blastomyces dermatitidis ER-3]OAT05320.1 murein transglycosylase [Blastomyces gilchristii SLH14081]
MPTMPSLRSLLLIPLLFWAPVKAVPHPEPCRGACNGRDPGFIRRADGRYFRFQSYNGISISSAPSMEGPWSAPRSMLPQGSSINLPGRRDLWAPDVYKVHDEYHVYYSVSTLGSRNSAIGLATSRTMEPGSWTDHGSVGVQTSERDNYNAIDGNLFEDADGSLRFNFGSYWGGLFQVGMNNDGTRTAPLSSAVNLAYEPGWNHHIEAAFLYRHHNDYYLFFSWGKAGDYDISPPAPGEEYRIKVCRSPMPSGPFVGSDGRPCTEGGGMTVLASHDNIFGPGGQGIMTTPEYGPVLYYHYTNTDIGWSNAEQLIGWNRLDFSSGWPVVV